MEFVPLVVGPVVVHDLHLLGEVQEQSLSNEGERGVRESERCRREQGRCEERAGKV